MRTRGKLKNEVRYDNYNRVHPQMITVFIGRERFQVRLPVDRLREIAPDVQAGDVLFWIPDISVAGRTPALMAVLSIIEAGSVNRPSSLYFAMFSVDKLADCWIFIRELIPTEMKFVYKTYFNAINAHKDNSRIQEILSSPEFATHFIAAISDEAINQTETREVHLPRQMPLICARLSGYMTSHNLVGSVFIGIAVILLIIWVYTR